MNDSQSSKEEKKKCHYFVELKRALDENDNRLLLGDGGGLGKQVAINGSMGIEENNYTPSTRLLGNGHCTETTVIE